MHTSALSAPLIDNPLFTIESLAKFLNVSPATIRDWVYKRQIPFKKLGRLVRFDPLDIQKWLETRSYNGNRGD